MRRKSDAERDRSGRIKYEPQVDGEKRCTRCGEDKPMTDFAPHRFARDGRASACRACRPAIDRKSKENPAVKARVDASKEKWRRLNMEAVYRYLMTHPCVDCGEADPIVLDFDHVSGEKIDSISRLLRRSSWARIMSEIEKCEVRCANCHRRKTAVQFGWYAYLGRDHEADAAEAVARVRADLPGQSSLFGP